MLRFRNNINANINDVRKQIVEFIYKYNFEKLHSAINYQTLAENYCHELLGVVA